MLPIFSIVPYKRSPSLSLLTPAGVPVGLPFGPVRLRIANLGTSAEASIPLSVHIVNPDAEIAPAFTAYIAETKDGRILSGILVGDTPTSVTLRGPLAVETVVLRSELAKLEALTNGITLPRGACNTWRALYLGLQTLREDLMAHIHLENNVLFERG